MAEAAGADLPDDSREEAMEETLDPGAEGAEGGGRHLQTNYKMETDMKLLNQAIADVNELDGQLFEAKMRFCQALNDAKEKLDKFYKSHRKSIEKARPYYKGKAQLVKIKRDLDAATESFQLALMEFEDARENEAVAQKALEANTDCNSLIGYGGAACDALDNWNKATQRVLRVSKQKAEAELLYETNKGEVQRLQAELEQKEKEHKKAIHEAGPYFSMRDALEEQLFIQLQDVKDSGCRVAAAKEAYKEAFARLDLVATEIEQRKSLTDLRNGNGVSGKDLSKFEEIDDIESALEARVENLSLSSDSLDLVDRDDQVSELDSSAGARAIKRSRSTSLVELSGHVTGDEKPDERTMQKRLSDAALHMEL